MNPSWHRAGFMQNFITASLRFRGQEWLDMKLYLIAKGTPLLEKGYKGVFESLSEEKQSELIGRKTVFARMAGIGL